MKKNVKSGGFEGINNAEGEEDFGVKTSEFIQSIHNREVERYREGGAPEILKKIERGEVSRQEMIKIITRRYEAAHFFESMLGVIIDGIDENRTFSPETKAALRRSVKENLKEELGEGGEYEGGPHSEGRKNLLMALGVDYDAWAARLGKYDRLKGVSAPSRNLIASLKKILNKGPLAGVAMLYYYEDRISLDGAGDYPMTLRGFEKIYPEFKKDKYQPGDALWHIASHAEHDTKHAEMAEEALRASVKCGADFNEVKVALDGARKALDKFWEELGREILKGESGSAE